MSEGANLKLRWVPPGPKALAFMQSRNVVQCIMGPIGGGKTSAVLMKAVFLAMQQTPSPADGVRRFKLCVVRDTYRQLWKTTIPSWWKWVPKEGPGIEWTGEKDGPAVHKILFKLRDATFVELIIEFAAIGEHAVEDFMRGYEPTAWYLNEADLLAKEMLTEAIGRKGRYPTLMAHGVKPSWEGVLMDCNAPEFDSWLYHKIHDEWKEGRELFTQAPAVLRDEATGTYRLNPHAENLSNLSDRYYVDILGESEDWYIQRMLMVKPGYRRDGKPVYATFHDNRHVASENLEPVEGLPLHIGADAGLTPAAVIGQWMPDGQWRILDEIVSKPGASMGPAEFSAVLKQVLAERYRGFLVQGWCDPAATFGGGKNEDEKRTWAAIVTAKTKIRFRPAGSLTNALAPRLDAVKNALKRTIDGATPGLLVSPRCSVLRKGFNAGYRTRKINVGEERYTVEPDKNEYSHVHDALQYLMLGGGELDEAMGRDRRARPSGPVEVIED